MRAVRGLCKDSPVEDDSLPVERKLSRQAVLLEMEATSAAADEKLQAALLDALAPVLTLLRTVRLLPLPEISKKENKNPLHWFLKCDDIYFGGTDLSRIECPVEEQAYKDSEYHPTKEGIATFYARDLLLKDEYVAAIRNNEGPLPVANQFEITPSDYWDHVKVICR